jgi:uncharacterized membrane protein
MYVTVTYSQGEATPSRSNGIDPEESLRRVGSALTGLGLVGAGLRRRSLIGILTAAGGGALLYRAAIPDGLAQKEQDSQVARTAQPAHGATSSLPFDIRRTITIGKGADDLYQLWRQPDTIRAIMAGTIDVVVESETTAHWRLALPAGQFVEWRSTITEERPGELIRWKSTGDTSLPNRGSVVFRPAPMGLGTEVTLEFSFDPPRGVAGDALMTIVDKLPVVSQWVPSYVAGKPLHRFKSLAETGEIPTTQGQPAARANTE